MDIILEFKTYLLDKKISNPTTLKNYLSDLRHFISWYERSFNITFSPEDFSQELINLYEGTNGASILPGGGVNHAEKMSLASTKRRLSSLRQFAKFAHEKNYIGENPFEIIAESKKPQEDVWHISEFKDYLKYKKASDLTIKNYVTDIHSFRRWYEQAIQPEINEVTFPIINDGIIEEYKNRLTELKSSAPRTVNRKLSSIRKFLEFAIASNLLTKNEIYAYESVSNISIPKPNEPTPSLSLNDIEEQKIKVEYSPFPPIRLFQRLIVLPYLLTEALIADKILSFIAGTSALKSVSSKSLSSLPKVNIPTKPSDLLKIKGYEKEFYAPNEISLDTYPFHKRVFHHLRHSRPAWYKKYHSLPVVHYIHFAILIIFAVGASVALYRNLVADVENPLFAAPTSPPRILSFQGRLTDNFSNPITSATDIRFAIYDDLSASGSALLWQEVHYDTVPDQDGIFSVLLGTNTAIPDSVFFENDNLYLGVTIEVTPELTPRRRIASVPYAANSESLQGMLPITDGSAGQTNVVLALDSSGDLTIGGSATPTFSATGGSFTLSGEVLYLTTETGSNTDVIIAPDGFGTIELHKPLTNGTATGNLVPGGVEINDKFGVLATESAGAAFVLRNDGGGDLFTASTSSTTRFTIENDGGLIIPSYNTAGGIFYANGSGVINQTAAGSNGECLQSTGGSTPTWGTCGSGSNWRIISGAISPLNDTLDFLIGANSTSSAQFAVLNVNGPENTMVKIGEGADTPATLSISGGIGDNAAVVIDQLNDGNILSASNSGTTVFTIENNGDIVVGPNGSGKLTAAVIDPYLILNQYTTGNTQLTFQTSAASNGDFIFQNQSTELATLFQAGRLHLQINGSSAGLQIGDDVQLFRGASNRLDVGSGDSINIVSGNVQVGGSTVIDSSSNATFNALSVSGGCTGCVSVFNSPFQLNNGAIVPAITTPDFLLGGQATNSAKFAVLGMNSDTPTASISALTGGNAGNGISLSTDGTIQSLRRNTLTVGGATTGNIRFMPNNNSNNLFLRGDSVAIGNTDPEANLDVSTTSLLSAPVNKIIWGSIGNTMGTLGYDGSANNEIRIGATSNVGLQLITSDTVQAYITSGGNFGIGTTGPDRRLESLDSSNPQLRLTHTDNTTYADFQVDSNGDLVINVDGQSDQLVLDNGGNVGFGTDAPSARIDVLGSGIFRNSSDTTDFLTIANSATETTFTRTTDGGTLGSVTLDSNGGLTSSSLSTQALTISTFSQNGGILYTNGSGVVAQTAAGTASQCLIGGTTPSFGSCATGVDESKWTQNLGALYPKISTLDFLLGGTSTASAKFAVLNMNSGTPTASVSATAVTDRPGLYMTGTGTLSSVNMGTLTIGSATTGNIVIEAGGSGVLNLNDNTNVTGNFDTSGTLAAGTGDAFTVNASGEITAPTSNTINSLNINSGALSGVTGFTQSSGAFAFSGAGNFSVDSAAFDVTTGGAVSGVTTLSLSGAISDTDSAVTINDDLDVSGTTGLSLTGAGADIAFSSGTNTISSAGTLELGAFTLTGAVTGNSQNVTGLNNLSAGGTITFGGFSANGGLLYTNGSGVVAQTTVGSSGECLKSAGGGTPTWGDCNAGGANQTPWTSDIDADGFDLFDLSNIQFRDTTGAPAGTVTSIFRDNTGDLNLNALSTKTVNLQVAGTDEYNFSATALAMNGNNITGVGTTLSAAAGLSISTTTTGALSLDSGTTGAVSLGTGANAKTVTVGNATTTTALALNSGTGDITLTSTDDVTINGGGGSAAINIGTVATAHTIGIGNTTGATAVTINSGTGAINIGTSIAKTLTIGNTTGATALNLDTGTGGINLGDNANTKTIDIGGVSNSGTDTINIATNGTAADTITIGNSNASTTVALTGGDDWSINSSGTITSASTTGISLTGAGSGITFSGSGNHDITASSGTLRLGAHTLTGAITGNSQSITGLNNLSAGGTITFGGFSTNGGLLYTNGSGVVAQLTSQGSAGECLKSAGAGSAPAFSSCAAGINSSPFQVLSGAIVPFNSTLDFMVGGQATASAKFSVTDLAKSSNAILNLEGSAYVRDLIAEDITLSGLSTSIITGYAGFDGYTGFTGGIGTGGNGKDSITGAQRIDSQGNLKNIASIQAGETLLTSGGTFATKVDYATGDEPRNIAIGDVNGDDRNDIAVVNNADNDISIFINNGDGTFATKVDYATGTNPRGIVISDLNGDGYADIAVSHFNSSYFSVFINNGDGTFATKVDYATNSSQSGQLATGDLNGDGKNDIAVTGKTFTQVQVFFNNGDGTFASNGNYTSGSSPEGIAIGDVNGDGKADLAVTNSLSTSVSIFINNGNGTFATKVDYTTLSSPNGVVLGDLNGDGKTDMAVANFSTSSTSVFINNGDGTFGAKVDYSVGGQNAGVAIGDLNGDGYPDLASTNIGGGVVGVLINNNDGTFQVSVPYSVGALPYANAIGDLNGDGKIDIATVNYLDDDISILLNNARPILYAQASTGRLGIGTTSPSSMLHVTRPLTHGVTGKALAIFDQIESQDILAASSSGTPRFAITNAGGIRLGTSEGSSGQCLKSGGAGSAAIWDSCGGSQTPWTSDIDADGFDLQDLSNIEFRDTTGAPAGTITSIFRDNTGDLNLNALSTKTVNLQVAGTDEYNFSSTALAMNGNNITGLGTTLSAAAGLTISTATNNSLTLSSAGTGDVLIDSDDTLLIDADGVLELNSSGGVISIGNDANSQNINIGTAGTRTLTIGSTNSTTALVFNTGTGGINFGDNANTKTIDIGGVTNSGTDTINIATNGTAADTIAIGNSNASTTVAITGGNDWSIDAAGNLTVASCTGCGGGGQTPWTSDIDADGFSLLDLGTNITARAGLTIGTTTTGALSLDSGTTGAINIGTGANAKTITIGNTTSSTAININTGSGDLNIDGKVFVDTDDVDIVTGQLLFNDFTVISSDREIYGANGDASAPTLSFNSDQDTGLFLATTDTIGVTTDGTERLRIGSDGRIGIGTSTAPGNLNLNPFVRIYNSASHTDPAASISARTTSAALVVTNDGTGDLIAASASGGMTFAVRRNGDILFTGTNIGPGADFAEYYKKENPNETFPAGTLICQTKNMGVTKCDSDNPDHILLGAMSDNPLITGGGDRKNDPNYVLVGLIGQLRLRVAGDIKVGDPLTISSQTGVAVKATGEAQIIGHAMESNNNGTKPRIASSIQKSYYNPYLSLNYAGDDTETFMASLNIQEVNGKWQITDALGNIVNRTSAFSNLVAANVKAGFVNTQKLVTNTLNASGANISNLTAGVINSTSATISNVSATSLNASTAVLGSVSVGSENVLIAGVSLRDYIAQIVEETISGGVFTNGQEIVSPIASIDEINTNIISPLGENEAIEIEVKPESIAINNSQTDETVVEIDNEGNATFSGSLASENLQTNDATISGTLSADRIIANTIDGLDDRISSVASSLITNHQSLATSSPITNHQSPITADEIDAGNIYADFGIYSEGLTVLGSTTTSSLTAMDSIAIGTGFIMTDNSINTLGATLEIQPLRQGDVSFMAGRVKIDTDGNVDINGNLNLAGRINAVEGVFNGIQTSSLAADIISPLSGPNLNIKLGDSASNSGSLIVRNQNDEEKLRISDEGDITASGSGTFDKINFNLVGEALADTDTTATATGSAGFATLNRNRPEITIFNDKITKDSLIYITPFGNTQNKVLYLLRQVPHTETTDGSFTVGVSGTPATIDMQFNWLIVN